MKSTFCGPGGRLTLQVASELVTVTITDPDGSNPRTVALDCMAASCLAAECERAADTAYGHLVAHHQAAAAVHNAKTGEVTA